MIKSHSNNLDTIPCIAISANNQFLMSTSLDKSMKMIGLPLPLPTKHISFQESSPTRNSIESSPSNNTELQFLRDKCNFLEGEVQVWKKRYEDAVAQVMRLTEQQQTSFKHNMF